MKGIDKSSKLYSPDLAPIPKEARTWNTWNLAALWVGMAVCIPTYILASYMIKSGLSWQAALIIIGLANLVITLPMVLNGHAGVKYGIPFPVIGRSAFGTQGIHVVSILRGIVACGWFGVQTWVGGLAIYSIWNAISGQDSTETLSIGKFLGFGFFWLINMFFIWKGTESIKWLEDLSAPILILIGLALIAWGWQAVGSFEQVLSKATQLQHKSFTVTKSSPTTLKVHIDPLVDKNNLPKATHFQILFPEQTISHSNWIKLEKAEVDILIQNNKLLGFQQVMNGEAALQLALKNENTTYQNLLSTKLELPATAKSKIWDYLLWFTAMVGFWATMSISISDITRLAKSQKDQLAGQFIGLPGTMIFYSFVGIFVTAAAAITFPDVMASENAPWDPISMVAHFENPLVVIFAQLAMLIATLSTNIAANVIAPANAFSNLSPKHISFKTGGLITGIIGIIICPWWLLDEISSIMIFISGLLGPVLGVLLCDYFIIQKKELDVPALFEPNGKYAFGGTGFHWAAFVALFAGMFTALIGYWVEVLNFLYTLSWYTGFIISFVLYFILASKKKLRLNS